MTDIPNHVGLIPDGHRRWAISASAHIETAYDIGVEKVYSFIDHLSHRGVKYFTISAMSRDNWLKRPRQEMEWLLRKLVISLEENRQGRLKYCKMHISGNLDEFPIDLSSRLKAICSNIKCEEGEYVNVNILLNYSPFVEIISAAKNLQLGDVDTGFEGVKSALYASTYPPIDLIVRSGGNLRLSGFAMLQSAYSEIAFVQTQWPQISMDEIDVVMASYASTERRFGG